MIIKTKNIKDICYNKYVYKEEAMHDKAWNKKLFNEMKTFTKREEQ